MKNPAIALILGWLFPGAGHFYIGQRPKGILLFALILAIFLGGVIVTKGGSVNFGRHPYAYSLQAATGVMAFATAAIVKDAPEPDASTMADFGMLLLLVAGAMNVLLMADALYYAKPEEEPA